MKKLFKILGITLLLILIILAAIPLVLESKIDAIVQNYVDKNLNAKVSFNDISLSLISSFPKASLSIEQLEIKNNAPFEDEILTSAKLISFEMPIAELFKNAEEDPLVINNIFAEELLLSLKSNKNGSVNYDILLDDENAQNSTDTGSTAFKFDIENYEIKNSALNYIDELDNTLVTLTEINHKGEGIFSAATSELKTYSEAVISLSMDSTNYLKNNRLKLDAVIDLDLEQYLFTFKENKGYINALPLEFDGFIQMITEGWKMDITFQNPESSFKDFLAIVPEGYAKDLSSLETSGNFSVNGKIAGIYSESSIPQFEIKMVSDNASFKFADLPKRVDNIIINASVINTTGLIDDTFVTIESFNFKIDDNVFRSSANIKNLTKEVFVNANIDGVLNLAHINKVYPIELKNQLSGIIKAKLNTSFDMDAINQSAYQRIKTVGNMSVTNFVFSSTDIINPIQINNADLTFKPEITSLNNFNALTGNSDLKATGSIQNILGFLLSDKKLIGNFNVDSNRFAISDFMVPETSETTKSSDVKTSESLKIPAFLECNINANAKEVIYDNLTLKNVKGQMAIKDQTAYLNNMSSSIFDGLLQLSGNVSTKDAQPSFTMNLGMSQFDIAQSFSGLEILTSLAPVAKVLQGKLNSTIELKGVLDNEFTPDLNSINGNAFAEILTTKINAANSPLLTQLDSQLQFIDLNKLDLKNLKTSLTFDKGQVVVKPFSLKYNDIDIEVSGSHSFSNTMNYSAVFNVPAKYLGTDINRLIGKINDNEVNKISIPVTANIGGTFTKPKVTTDLSSGVANLTKQLIEIEKQKLIDKGTGKVTDLLGGLLGNTKTTPNQGTKTDSVKVDTTANTSKTKVKEGVKSILGGIIDKSKNNKTKKAKDSIKN